MEGLTIESRENEENKEFTAEEIESIRKIVSEDKDYRFRFLRQAEEGDDEKLIEDARRLFEEAEKVEKLLDK